MVQQLVIPMLIILLGSIPGTPNNNRADDPNSSSHKLFVSIGAKKAGDAVMKGSYRLRRGAAQRKGKSIEEILSDKSLWGAGFPSALAALPAMSRMGEKRVWVFQDKMLGETKYAGREEAYGASLKLTEELKIVPKPRSSQFAALIANVAPLKVEVHYLTEDRSYRISAAGPQFLPDRLSMAMVRSRLGKEERVSTELLDDGTERRPVVLTLHHYAGGAIVFVESDLNPNIGSVDRVFLDAPKISASIF